MLLRKTSPMNDSIDDPVPDNAKLIKLEAGRSSVQFKPSKRMKKRRQLDALVGNEKKLSRRKPSAHELLRSNDSGSSEVEEFGIIHGHKLDKSWTSSCCFTCYSLTCALLVTSCLLACATLIWMHLELKRDFNDLRDRLQLVENKNAGIPEEFQALQSKLNLIDKSLNDIRTGKHGLQSLNESIISMQVQIASLAATQQQQQQSIQTSNSHDNNHEDVAKTVADLGSGLHTAQNEISTIKESQKTFTSQLSELTTKVNSLENHGGREGGVSQSDTEGLQAMVTQINSTLSQTVAKAVTDLSKQQTHIEALDQFTQGLQTQVHKLVLSLNASQHILQDALLPQNTTAGGADELTQLQKKVDELQLTLEQGLLLLHHLQSEESNLTKTESSSSTDLSSPSPSDTLFETLLKEHREFVHFKTEVYQDISILNATMAFVNGTIDILRKDTGDVSTKVSQAVQDISNITTVVENLVSFVHSHDLTAAHGADSGNINRNGQSSQNTGGGVDTTAKPGEAAQSNSQSEQPAQNS